MKKQKIKKRRHTFPAGINEMFNLQEKFQKRFYNFEAMDTVQIIEYQRLMLTCVVMEAMGALDWLDWKPWKKRNPNLTGMNS